MSDKITVGLPWMGSNLWTFGNVYQNDLIRTIQKETRTRTWMRRVKNTNPTPTQPCLGELIYSGDPWRVYRVDAGMGEHEYVMLRGENFFCRTEHRQCAFEIINAFRRAGA